ncbi:S-adenosyl-L-methionine-dependent methyltransferase [Chytridium lagenaria]|nr:S-adenosyl-L-methionine-dependent methyltransferase [Chytridium lagenaria]
MAAPWEENESLSDLSKEEAIIAYVLANSTKGDPESVVKAFDDFGYKHKWFMAVGDVKGKIVEEVITSNPPKTMAEIGGKYISFEFAQEYANLAQKAVDQAGLTDVVTIVVGSFDQKYAQLKEQFGLDSVDIWFIDHVKNLYLSDYKLIEAKKLIHSGTIIIADNVIKPGAPDYLDYVSVNLPAVPGVERSTLIKSHKLIMTTLEYADVEDAISVSVIA